MAKRRHAGRRAAGNRTDATEAHTGPPRAHGRRRSTGQHDTRSSTLPSAAEIGVYGALATIVAVVVMITNARPWWQAAVVVGGAVVVVGALMVAAGRPQTPDENSTRRPRRRRRR